MKTTQLKCKICKTGFMVATEFEAFPEEHGWPPSGRLYKHVCSKCESEEYINGVQYPTYDYSDREVITSTANEDGIT